MEIKLDYSITCSEFLDVIESVGWKTYSIEQVEKADFKYKREKITGMYL